MQMTAFPPPQNHFEQRSPPGKFHSHFTTSSPVNKGTNKNIRMALPPTNTNKNNNTRSSFSAVGASSNMPFGKSKFFLKKEIKAATKIQAIIRAFLVQARLYRERVLAPRQRELEEVQSRKLEELKRIQDQFEQEYAELPLKMEQDFEDALLTKDGLEEKIKLLKTVNEELSEERKEAKKMNRKLEAESQSLKEQCFKLDVHIHKTQKENQELQSTFAEYEWAVNCGNQQRDELEAALMKCVKQQEVLKRYINKAVKKVETRSLSLPRRSSSKKQIKRSSSSGCAAAFRRASTTSGVRRSKSSKHPVPLNNSPSSPSGGKKKRPSLNKNIDGHASFDWSRMSDRNLNVLDSSEDSQKQKLQAPKKRPSLNKNIDGHASFNWASMSDRNLNVDAMDGSAESFSQLDLLEKQPEDQACFDWANNSYTWAGQAADAVGHQSMSALHDIVSSSGGTESSTKVTRKSLPRLNRRRHSEMPHTHQGKSSSSSSSASTCADANGMRELLQEIKTIKKEGAVWVDWRGKTRQIKPSWA